MLMICPSTLPDAEALADMTPAEDISVGMDPAVPLREIGLEPEVDPEREETDPHVIDVLVLPKPISWKGGRLLYCHVLKMLTLLFRPSIFHLQKALKTWSREDLHVRVFQGVRTGGPKARQACCRETFDMETGSLLAHEYFDPGKGSTRLPSPALPDCSPSSSHSLCVRSVFWYSEL